MRAFSLDQKHTNKHPYLSLQIVTLVSLLCAFQRLEETLIAIRFEMTS